METKKMYNVDKSSCIYYIKHIFRNLIEIKAMKDMALPKTWVFT